MLRSVTPVGLHLPWTKLFLTIHKASYLGFSAFPPPNCLLKNLARFLSIISSWVRPSFPFSTAFFEAVCEAALAWSPPESADDGWKKRKERTVTLTNLQLRRFALLKSLRFLTFLFGIFTFLASLLLAFVSIFCLNHRLHSFLGFLRCIEIPHRDGGLGFAADLRLPAKHTHHINDDALSLSAENNITMWTYLGFYWSNSSVTVT